MDNPNEIPDDAADSNIITPEEARWILGYYNLPGGEHAVPSFRAALISAMAHADLDNRRRLALGFPGMVAAFDAQQDVAGLQSIAGSDRATWFSWTQPICETCFRIRQPDRKPIRVKQSRTPYEACVDCGQRTISGMFVRVDPATANHPTRVKD